MSKFPEQEHFDYHPSEDTSDRFPEDRLMRNHGFKIWSRKGNQEPEWEKRGIVYKQSQVIEFINNLMGIKYE